MKDGVHARGWRAAEQEGWGKRRGSPVSVSQMIGPLPGLSHEVTLL